MALLRLASGLRTDRIRRRPGNQTILPDSFMLPFRRWRSRYATHRPHIILAVLSRGTLSVMRLNYETCVVGEKCVLVPYRPQHVERYHEWMKDPALLEATGSEPLSMEEEIAMQQSWRDDPEKLTFIILAREACDFIDDKGEDCDFVIRNLNAMVGDVNLFLSEEEEDDDNDGEVDPSESNGSNEPRRKQAELDIMIAEQEYQKRGMGREVSCLMMLYGAKNLGIRRFFCKINEDNIASRALFRKLGFLQCDYAECFKQVELELKKDTSQEVIETIEELYGGNMTTIACPCSDIEVNREVS